MYHFYYTYLGEIYGVLAHKDSSLLVELIRTDEIEKVSARWLREEILKGRVDISLSKDNLSFYKKQKLSDYLPTSS